MRKAIVIAMSLLLLISIAALADGPATKKSPPAAAKETSRVLAGRGVHINSVRVEGSCGEAARFVVEIQNNLTKVARLGNVFVGAANSPGNRPGNPTAEFRDLAPGQRRTLTLNSTWHLSCQVGETGPECFEVGIVMEPDNTANGEIWDSVWHRVCSQLPKTGQKSGPVRFNDTTFTR
jgi:hypothetical protein